MPSEVNITWSGFLSHHKILDLLNLPMESAELHFSLSLIELLNLPTESVELHFSLRLISVELLFSLSLILEFQPFDKTTSLHLLRLRFHRLEILHSKVHFTEIVVEGKGSHGV